MLLFFRFEAQRNLLALLELFVFLFKAHADHMQIHLFHVQTRHGFNRLAHILLRAAANLLDGHAVIDRHADVNADVLAVHIHAHAARQLALAQQTAVARNGGDAVHFRGGHAHDGRNDFIGVCDLTVILLAVDIDVLIFVHFKNTSLWIFTSIADFPSVYNSNSLIF